jgi:Fe-S cluster assembly iron-binding protein IscA
MLQVTDSAISVLQEARAAQELPESVGVRVFAQTGNDGQAALAVAFAEAPMEGDQVTEQGGTEIYVAPEVAEPLADSMLDVQDTVEGPQLALVPLPDEPG